MVRHDRSRSTAAAGVVLALAVAVMQAHGSRGRPETHDSKATLSSTGGWPDRDPFDPDEAVLPGGARVFSHAEPHEPLVVRGGRYAVRLSRRVLYQAELPVGSSIYAGSFIRLPAGRDGLMFISDAPGATTGMPGRHCLDLDFRSPGPTVRDLAQALARSPHLHATTPRPTRIDGQPALLVTMALTADVDITSCIDRTVALGDHDALSTARVHRLWVMQVAGRRVVLHTVQGAGALGRDVAMLDRMVRTVTFVRG